VEDPAARTLIGEFYAQRDWRTDPAQALARVQAALDARAPDSVDKATMPQQWAAFSVLRRAPAVVERSQ
jgi:CHAT domain-containing protein